MKFADIRHHALSLPESTEAPHFNYTSFRVRGKIFVTAPPEQEHVHIFLPEQEREAALPLAPEYLEKLLWGGKVVGLRVSISKAKPSLVKELISKAWIHKAPKSLLTRI